MTPVSLTDVSSSTRRGRSCPSYVPTFGEALDACGGLWVNIEIKNDEADPDFDPLDRVAVEVLATLAERGRGRWLISSFRLATVDRCRLLDPTVPTAWLTMEFGAETIDLAAARGHTALHPWESTVTAERDRALPRRGHPRQRLDVQRPAARRRPRDGRR